ncbi:glycoside hydrolase family 97 protein [Chitinophagaceae bacterium LB-8]|uniref:Glycoside hydrolase family 97 protein n=1 Tax=Paraflavisolibacter caeni TaxID=2982496 RepID=A0A9X2XWH0_9BACT|nr:glycoside hydrolase family 97 protein [Paraflavisolibacter caeni]MCU7550180.1 glycoside hydrolase family 97 protein [Paraflavisolibacter caeni]
MKILPNKIALLVLHILACKAAWTQLSSTSISSPDKKIRINVSLDPAQQAFYTITYNNETVLEPSKLGVKRQDADFSTGLSLVSSSAIEKVTDSYQLVSGKRTKNQYLANKKIFHFRNAGNDAIDVIFQVSNDGVAFRYYFPSTSKDVKTITSEATTFHFPTAAKGWLQPAQVAKSGWEQSNPAYEEHYQQAINVGTPSTYGAGWVYPALFQYKNTWVLLTEASMDGKYCASRLSSESPNGEYSLAFPDSREVISENGLLPTSTLPFASPWRIITIGSLKTIAESTLGTDLAAPATAMNRSFIKPGKASWSWINSKDDFIIYPEQKKYIDFAAEMNWQYCLVDADWDKKIGYDKIKELADYAKTKNVGLLLWYNSAGNWNTVKYTPKGLLLTHESRVKEFSRLKEMGIKGVKIDFFGGDGRSVIQYYIDILKDAAQFDLMVNFHGATLPRGWNRTYPHLMTTEAIRGFEMVTFGQQDADMQPTHCTMLPFTRNAFDPMDFTPMNLFKIPTKVQRKTSSGFELALAVLFVSGIQHFAESPEGMAHVPNDVKQFLRDLPTQWDDVRFIDGFPGKYVILARKSGSKWYISGINAENTAKDISLDLSSFGKKKATLITDGAEPLTFATEKNITGKTKQLTLKPSGGFVMILE